MRVKIPVLCKVVCVRVKIPVLCKVVCVRVTMSVLVDFSLYLFLGFFHLVHDSLSPSPSPSLSLSLSLSLLVVIYCQETILGRKVQC